VPVEKIAPQTILLNRETLKPLVVTEVTSQGVAALQADAAGKAIETVTLPVEKLGDFRVPTFAPSAPAYEMPKTKPTVSSPAEARYSRHSYQTYASDGRHLAFIGAFESTSVDSLGALARLNGDLGTAAARARIMMKAPNERLPLIAERRMQRAQLVRSLITPHSEDESMVVGIEGKLPMAKARLKENIELAQQGKLPGQAQAVSMPQQLVEKLDAPELVEADVVAVTQELLNQAYPVPMLTQMELPLEDTSSPAYDALPSQPLPLDAFATTAGFGKLFTGKIETQYNFGNDLPVLNIVKTDNVLDVAHDLEAAELAALKGRMSELPDGYTYVTLRMPDYGAAYGMPEGSHHAVVAVIRNENLPKTVNDILDSKVGYHNVPKGIGRLERPDVLFYLSFTVNPLEDGEHNITVQAIATYESLRMTRETCLNLRNYLSQHYPGQEINTTFGNPKTAPGMRRLFTRLFPDAELNGVRPAGKQTGFWRGRIPALTQTAVSSPAAKPVAVSTAQKKAIAQELHQVLSHLKADLVELETLAGRALDVPVGEPLPKALGPQAEVIGMRMLDRLRSIESPVVKNTLRYGYPLLETDVANKLTPLTLCLADADPQEGDATLIRGSLDEAHRMFGRLEAVTAENIQLASLPDGAVYINVPAVSSPALSS